MRLCYRRKGKAMYINRINVEIVYTRYVELHKTEILDSFT
jgi:hypothetical protein